MKADDMVFREIGKIDEFERQIQIGDSLGLDIVGPVYKSWKPSSRLVWNVAKNKNLRDISTFDLLLQALSIILEYGLVTVRQVYYVLVSQQSINNNLNEYRRVVRVLIRGRLAGLIKFDSIIDDTREAEKTPSWSSIDRILLAAVDQFRSDWWHDQPRHVEVWLEKRALRRIFYPITNMYDVYLCTGGGYQSWSEVWKARTRFLAREGKALTVLYFGDCDPSGKDMVRDIRDRFNTLGLDVDVKEVALTNDDILKFDLPRNPTKKKDSRADWYIKKYGINYAVELDALPPEILRDRIRWAIKKHCNHDLLMGKKTEDNLQRELWRKRIFDFE